MLNGKFGQLSIMTHHGVRIDSQQFVSATKDVWEAESVVSKYSAISAPFMSANGATALQQTSCDEPRSCCDPSALLRTV